MTELGTLVIGARDSVTLVVKQTKESVELEITTTTGEINQTQRVLLKEKDLICLGDFFTDASQKI